MAEAVRKAGPWLACRSGCSACCVGPFPVTPLDAIRLREGLKDLQNRDARCARRVLDRAHQSAERLRRSYPVDTVATILAQNDAAEEELCPALDPEARTCDLYSARPITCRKFGPAVRFSSESGDEAALAVCELCFVGAAPAEIAACAVEVDPQGLEADLLRQLEAETGKRGDTLVAFALVEEEG